MSMGGGCEVAVTARAICGLVKCWECGQLLYINWLPLMLNGAVH